MRKILKIPVIGLVLRWVISLVKLPVRFDAIFGKLKEIEIEINEMESTIQQALVENCDVKEKHQILQDMHFELKKMQQQLKDNVDFLECQIQSQSEISNAHDISLQQCIEDISEIRIKAQEGSFDTVIYNYDKVKLLNWVLSAHPTVWGDSNKIHLSPLASMPGCFFNTNSGTITVGDYTFSGSNVSILAGSHDENLSGLLRRDCEITKGCDIVIGNGVWLASNCTILGPCMIGDNSVIASGAVVVPGTVVPENTIYAGIPAKQIKTIHPNNDIENRHTQLALERSNNILFYSGWTEKRECLCQNKMMLGHWNVSNTAEIYTSASKIKIYLHTKDENNLVIQIKYNDKVIVKEISEDVSFILEISEKQNEITLILFETKNEDFSLFVSASFIE